MTTLPTPPALGRHLVIGAGEVGTAVARLLADGLQKLFPILANSIR
mgnify:CR=1 FL=1